MNPEQTAFMVPRAVPVPRGAQWAAELVITVLQGLHRLAVRTPARPVVLQKKPPPNPEQRTLEAAEVRELAFSYLKQDPAFAGDLLAAADRHERDE